MHNSCEKNQMKRVEVVRNVNFLSIKIFKLIPEFRSTTPIYVKIPPYTERL